jgi:hypothetical protein
LGDKEDTRFVLALYDVASNVADEGAIITVSKPSFSPFSLDGKVVILLVLIEYVVCFIYQTVYPMLLIDNHSIVTIDGQPIPAKSKALPVIE